MAKTRPNVFLYISTITANLLSLGVGNVFSWTSPVIPQLKSDDPHINPLGYKIGASEESLIASLQCLGAAAGPFIASFTVDRIGRKKSFLCLVPPMVVCYLTLAFAKKVWLFYLSRLVIGMGVGCIMCIVPIYLGEIAEDHNRGLLGCFLEVFITVGILYCNVIGHFTNIQGLSLFSAAPYVIFAVIFGFFIPESPYYYTLIGDHKSAEASLRKLRKLSNDLQIQSELKEIQKNVQESVELKRTFKDLFKSTELIRGLTVSVGLMFIQQFCGIGPVIYYMEPIFRAAETTIPYYISTIIISIIQVFVCVLTSQLIERLGRRILLIASSIGLSLALIILGIYFYLLDNSFDVSHLFWLPLLSLTIFIVSFVLGAGPISWAMLGELFPPDVKALAAPLSTSLCMLFSYITTSVFPHFVDIFGMSITLWMLALCCILGVFFVVFKVPETKGKSLNEIQICLGKKL